MPYDSSIARVSRSIASVTSSRSGLLLEREPDPRDLPREVLGVRERAGVDLAVAFDLGAIAVRLAVLREQDQRRRVGGLGREREVQQDERVGIPRVRDTRSR